MPKDMVDGKIQHSKLAKVPEKHIDRLSRFQIFQGDILVARKGDVRKCVLITKSENGWLTGSDCLKIVLEKEYVYPQFIYYQLKSPFIGKWLETISIGSTMPSINTTLLSNIELSIPPLATQQKIAGILSAYDDLIENNRRQIRLLEEAGQKLYKEWFVKLRFPGYENTKIIDGVPEGWKKEKVGNLIKTLSKTKQVKTGEMLKKGIIPVIDQSRDFIAGYTNDEETMIMEKVPVIVFGDHTRVLKLIQFPFARGADGTQVFISADVNIGEYQLFCALKEVDLSNYSYARHFKYLKEEEIIIPSKDISQKFERIVKNNFIMIQLLRNKVQLLQSARDKLLPRLMNGEIEV